MSPMIVATVSGSFHRHMAAIRDAVMEFVDLGVHVLSPSDPRIVDQRGDFLFVASDRVRSVRMVEDRHLECIRASHFLWLVAPDGYVGQSASLEVGFAITVGTPIFGAVRPFDLTLRQYVRQVPSMRAAIEAAVTERRGTPLNLAGFLIDPLRNVDAAHDALDAVRKLLLRSPALIDEHASEEVRSRRREIADLILGAEHLPRAFSFRAKAGSK